MGIPERSNDYYAGVADAMDVIRERDWPLTRRVDLVADRLAPSADGAPERVWLLGTLWTADEAEVERVRAAGVAVVGPYVPPPNRGAA